MVVKKILQGLLFICVCFFATYSSTVDTLNRASHVQNNISSPHHKTIKKSIDSSVRIISTINSYEESGLTSHSSGTYAEHDGVMYVITTSHSIIGECEDTHIIADGLLYDCLSIVFSEPSIDIAILQVGKIYNRIPIKISKSLYSEEALKKHIGIQQKIIYTGYPQGLGPFTFSGNIVNHTTQNDIIFAHSYAWAGSSGSGVFNASGGLIGVLTAVSVANSEYGVDVMEDLIIVTPLRLNDIEHILLRKEDVQIE